MYLIVSRDQWYLSEDDPCRVSLEEEKCVQVPTDWTIARVQLEVNIIRAKMDVEAAESELQLANDRLTHLMMCVRD